MRVAAIDLGSNTFLCLIAEVQSGKVVNVIEDQMRVVRLGQELGSSGKFHPDALTRADLCLAEFSKMISQHNPDKVLAVATAAARTATNGELLIELGHKHGIPINIISGVEEQLISYAGGTSSLKNPGHYLLIDIGGGSTEIVYGTESIRLSGHSFPFGAVKLTERFVKGVYPISEAVKKEIRTHLQDEIRSMAQQLLGKPITSVIAVAGTPTTLASIELGGFDAKKIDGYTFTLDRLQHWEHVLCGLKPEEIRKAYAVEVGRADVIAVGNIILETILQTFSLRALHVSTRGVRFGVAMKMAEGVDV